MDWHYAEVSKSHAKSIQARNWYLPMQVRPRLALVAGSAS
jgi:hypothetical protein